MNTQKPDSVTLAITGASGAPYALRLLECLIQNDVHTYLMVSQPGQVVLSMETDLQAPSRPKELQAFFSERFNAAQGQLEVFGKEQWTAPIASGSGVADSMVICPCTAGTLSAVACGSSNHLIERAADVTIKEQRRLIMVVREMPFSAIHLENMLKLARLGVIIMPANPGFYHQPESIDDLVDFVVARILDQLGIEQTLLETWGGQDGTD